VNVFPTQMSTLSHSHSELCRGRTGGSSGAFWVAVVQFVRPLTPDPVQPNESTFLQFWPRGKRNVKQSWSQTEKGQTSGEAGGGLKNKF